MTTNVTHNSEAKCIKCGAVMEEYRRGGLCPHCNSPRPAYDPRPTYKTISGFEMYSSPEFLALCRKFGIAWDLGTKDITIRLTEEEVYVDQTYKLQRPIQIDTTTLKNTTYRTKEPVQGQAVTADQIIEGEKDRPTFTVTRMTIGEPFRALANLLDDPARQIGLAQRDHGLYNDLVRSAKSFCSDVWGIDNLFDFCHKVEGEQQPVPFHEVKVDIEAFMRS